MRQFDLTEAARQLVNPRFGQQATVVMPDDLDEHTAITAAVLVHNYISSRLNHNVPEFRSGEWVDSLASQIRLNLLMSLRRFRR